MITTGITTGPVKHVPVCTTIQYSTDPPTWGDHWLFWAAYKKYTTPVPREMYVHNQEHGGVVLSYNCAAACPEVVSLLDQVFDARPDDVLCTKVPGGPKTRMVLTPDAKQLAPIVASAWNATYTATCIDKESLSNFVAEVYGKGTEVTCGNGFDLEDASQGSLDCSGGNP